MPHEPRVCIFQHVPFEGPAAIEKWVYDKGGSLSVTKLYENAPLPSQSEFDWLILMGGPMGVDNFEEYPWLVEERRFILETIELGKHVIGICLGAQLIAAALGATVKKNEHREIGWFEVRRAPNVSRTVLCDIWPERVNVFHWHGDTFEIPKDAELIASSDACANQGFILGDRVVGLQFHLEVTPDSVTSLIENCQNELDGSEHLQSTDHLIASDQRFIEANKLLLRLLDKFAL